MKAMIKKAFLSLLVLAIAVGLDSCSKNAVDPVSATVKASITDDATEQSGEDEIDDISSVQLQAASQISGRIATTDIRVACAKISGVVHDKSGAILINFDSTSTGASTSGCTDAMSNVRKGQIKISWTGGKWYAQGSAITISLVNYSINGLVINGQRTLTNITDPAHPFVIVWTVSASHTYTWPDKTTASRTVNKTKTWDVLQGTVTVTETSGTSAVTGTDRHGTSYTVEITDGLVYTAQCAGKNDIFIPVAGTQQLTINGGTIIVINYGANTCDNNFTITINNKTEVYTLTKAS